MGKKEIRFDVDCGDWIYPSKDSVTKTKYDIDFPLVALIYVAKERIGVTVSSRSRIHEHLQGPRFLCCEIISGKAVTDYALCIRSLKNRSEEEFEREINAEIQFDTRSLDRGDELWPDGFESSFQNKTRMNGDDWWAILFASIILQAHKRGCDLPEGISFRNATVPEIQGLGRW